MAVVTELFRSEDNGTLSFGDYTLAQKAKKGDIQFEGDIYKIKTFKTMTKLDKNGQLIFESVPGSAVHNFVATTDGVAFEIESSSDVQVTLEVEAGQEYKVFIDNTNVGMMKANLGGKLTLSVEFRLEECRSCFSNSSNIKEHQWQNKRQFIFAASVVMSLPSGWGSVLPVSSGILLQKRKLQKRKKEGRSL